MIERGGEIPRGGGGGGCGGVGYYPSSHPTQARNKEPATTDDNAPGFNKKSKQPRNEREYSPQPGTLFGDVRLCLH